MPQSHREDPDPLLEFSSETSTADDQLAALEPAEEPVTATEDADETPRLDRVDALAARIAHLERALDESKTQVTSLKSEVRTLVRAMADIRTPHRPALPGAAVAVVALILGVAVAVAGWRYFPRDAVAASTVAAEQPVAAATPRIVTVTGSAPAASAEPAPAPPRVAPQVARPARQPASNTARTSVDPVTRYVGTLTVDASPGGNVFVNRRSAGKTPLRLEDLRAGSHLIWIERDGYARWTRVVNVPANRVSRVSAELEPLAR